MGAAPRDWQDVVNRPAARPPIEWGVIFTAVSNLNSAKLAFPAVAVIDGSSDTIRCGLFLAQRYLSRREDKKSAARR